MTKDNKKYSRVDKEKLSEFINKSTKKASCPLCGTNNFMLLYDDEIKGFYITESDLEIYDEKGERTSNSISSYVLACTNCGNQHFMNASFIYNSYKKSDL